MMTSGELAMLRRESERTMADRVQILRPVNVADAGGLATSFTVVTSVKCRVAPSQYQASERQVGGALQGSASWKITVPALTDVDQPDRLSVGSTLSGSGLTEAQVRAGGGRLFEVIGVAGPRTLEITRIVYANEIG